MYKFIIITFLIFTIQFIGASIVKGYFTYKSETQIGQFIFEGQDEVESISNGRFVNHLEKWTTEGYTEIINDSALGQVAKVGSSRFESQDSSIAQNFRTENNNNNFLYLVYQLSSAETLSGFDEPSFLVLIDNRPIFATSQTTTNWQHLTLPLPMISTTLELKILVQNSGDNLAGPELQLAYVSTLEPMIHPELPTPKLKEISEVVSLQNVEIIKTNSGTFIKFDNPDLQFPARHYELVLQELKIVAKFTNRFKVAENIAEFATINSTEEILSISPALEQGEYLLKALDEHGHTLAEGRVSLAQ